jgi:hypothetical protein
MVASIFHVAMNSRKGGMKKLKIVLQVFCLHFFADSSTLNFGRIPPSGAHQHAQSRVKSGFNLRFQKLQSMPARAGCKARCKHGSCRRHVFRSGFISLFTAAACLSLIVDAQSRPTPARVIPGGQEQANHSDRPGFAWRVGQFRRADSA